MEKWAWLNGWETVVRSRGCVEEVEAIEERREHLAAEDNCDTACLSIVE